MVNSREIAERFSKKNKDVNEAIRNLIKKNPELSKHFIESSYISSRGRCDIQFEIDDIGADILSNKFKYNVRSARFEYKYLNEIKDFLDAMNISYITQYPIDNYRRDLYIPEYNIAIEIDEREHKYKKRYDKLRQNYIENHIYCKFMRINEGESYGSVMARLVKELNLVCYKSA